MAGRGRGVAWLILASVLAGCVLAGHDYHDPPQLLVRLVPRGPQLCADVQDRVTGKWYRQMVVFVHRRGLPPAPVTVTANSLAVPFSSTNSCRFRYRAGLGHHELVVTSAGYRVERPFTVFLCKKGL